MVGRRIANRRVTRAKGRIARLAPRVSAPIMRVAAPRAPRKRLLSTETRAKILPGIGKMLGGLLGGPMGAKLGGLAGSGISKITGMGTYTINSNTIMDSAHAQINGDIGTQTPVVQNTHSGVRITHREYIGDVSSSIGFVNTGFNINPGLNATFPWLSNVASNFQQYKFHGLVFTYISTSADALTSTNTALGTVVMATDYNASSALFLNKSQMENTEYCTSMKPSVSFLHGIECEASQTPMDKLYIRTPGALPANQDIKSYDLGLFQLATAGSQAAAVVGELHVSYDIELYKPIDISVLDNAGVVSHYALNTPVVTTAYFGTSQTQRFDSLGLTITGTTITFPTSVFPAQTYYVGYSIFGMSAAVATPTITLSNCAFKTVWNAGASNTVSNSGSTSANYLLEFVVSISGTANSANLATIVFSGGTLPTATANGDLWVIQIPSQTV